MVEGGQEPPKVKKIPFYYIFRFFFVFSNYEIQNITREIVNIIEGAIADLLVIHYWIYTCYMALSHENYEDMYSYLNIFEHAAPDHKYMTK